MQRVQIYGGASNTVAQRTVEDRVDENEHSLPNREVSMTEA